MPNDKKDPDDLLDRHVGARLRERRGILNYSLQDLARAVGLSPKQLERYESGAEHLPEPILYELCHILYTTPNYFFAGDYELLEPVELVEEARKLREDSLFTCRETLELIKIWYAIGDRGVRSSCMEFLRAVVLGYEMRRANR